MLRSGTALSELLVGDIHVDGVIDVQHYAAGLIVGDDRQFPTLERGISQMFRWCVSKQSESRVQHIQKIIGPVGASAVVWSDKNVNVGHQCSMVLENVVPSVILRITTE